MSIIENKFEKIYLRDEFIDMRDGGTPLFKDRYAPFGKLCSWFPKWWSVLAHFNANLRSRRKSYEIVLHSARRASHYVVEYLRYWSILTILTVGKNWTRTDKTEVTFGNVRLSCQQITRDDLKWTDTFNLNPTKFKIENHFGKT